MSDIWTSITNREIAAVFWFGVFLAVVLVGRDTRQGLAGVLRAFFNPIIVLPLTFAAIYASGEIYVVGKFGWWSLANLKTTVVWLVTFAFVTMFEVVSAKIRKGGLSRITREILTVATVLTFITELQSFPLVSAWQGCRAGHLAFQRPI
ncbi:hypothetical protein E5554_12295 [Sphingobium sp. PAMC28499]|uniref:hypothetical protein n=1 Tax=Sphingobium sp. PAMC28499 TaxID=2565554 RepID=UPI00109D8D37|nr:hypothetical protein [Sphingobium sp. PAMC28499]QCB38541.1 hypothetical protein E5554_12295 [Sphingobium sp. PAMC28499]